MFSSARIYQSSKVLSFDGATDGYGLIWVMSAYDKLKSNRLQLGMDVAEVKHRAGVVWDAVWDIVVDAFYTYVSYLWVVVLFPALLLWIQLEKLLYRLMATRVEVNTMENYVLYKKQQDSVKEAILMLDELKRDADAEDILLKKLALRFHRRVRPLLIRRLDLITGRLDALNMKNYKGRMRVVTEDESWRNRSQAYGYIR